MFASGRWRQKRLFGERQAIAASSLLAQLDAKVLLHLVIACVAEDDALCLALTCRPICDLLSGPLSSPRPGALVPGQLQG
jgi:hypothetical protein